MDRVEFTKNIVKLIQMMIEAGDRPVIDYVLRSREEQKRLYDKRLSKCDGKVRVSDHQSATAMDIYLADEKGNIIFDTDNPKNIQYKNKMYYWHSVWDKMLGGDKIIRWDRGHFSGGK